MSSAVIVALPGMAARCLVAPRLAAPRGRMIETLIRWRTGDRVPGGKVT